METELWTMTDTLPNGTKVEVKSFDVRCGENPKICDAIKWQQAFKDNGFDVTLEAIFHNYEAWLRDEKSGYRDEANGYHLFSPCGCNPFRLSASELHDGLRWQHTYTC